MSSFSRETSAADRRHQAAITVRALQQLDEENRRFYELVNAKRVTRARAKYYPNADGSLRLAIVQEFSEPRFVAERFGEPNASKKQKRDADDPCDVIDVVQGLPCDIERAVRRAQIAAFDKIAANVDMTLFSTLTFDPSSFSGDLTAYDDAYAVLKPWLSNLVSRHGFKYVIAPERHKSGALHFHCISNAPEALRLAPAFSPRTGRALTHGGKPLQNVTAWKHGHSSAEFIGAERTDRDAVAKYIFKYMGKQAGTKIGGRYLLSGGDFVEPVYIYGESLSEFIDGSDSAKYDREVIIYEGLTFKEVSFI